MSRVWFIVVTAVGLLMGGAWLSPPVDGADRTPPSAEALKTVGPTLAKAFTFEPFQPPMLDHLWMDVGNGRAIFMHFNKPVSDSAASLIFLGEGIEGRYCAEDQPEGGKTGFVHFHRARTPSGETGQGAHGHGGGKGEEGYWLRHYAVAEFDMMGMHFKPGTAMNFMATPAPKCGS